MRLDHLLSKELERRGSSTGLVPAIMLQRKAQVDPSFDSTIKCCDVFGGCAGKVTLRLNSGFSLREKTDLNLVFNWLVDFLCIVSSRHVEIANSARPCGDVVKSKASWYSPCRRAIGSVVMGAISSVG